MKKSFVLYTDFYEGVQFLNNEQKGQLLDMIFKYMRGEEFGEYDPMAVVSFNFLKPILDRDGEKYEKEIRARSEAGKKGMAKRWGKKRITKHNSVIESITKITDNDNVNVNDNDMYVDIVNHFSEVTGRKYKSLERKSVDFWLKEGFSLEELKKAISNIPHLEKNDKEGGFWRGMTPTRFFRQRNSIGKTDTIEQALNYKSKSTLNFE